MRNNRVIDGNQDHNFVYNFKLNKNYHIQGNKLFLSSRDKEDSSIDLDYSTNNSGYSVWLKECSMKKMILLTI